MGKGDGQVLDSVKGKMVALLAHSLHNGHDLVLARPKLFNHGEEQSLVSDRVPFLRGFLGHDETSTMEIEGSQYDDGY